MNIFFIPSWYPNQTNPLSGVFIKEQVETIAELEENISALVSLWGHDDSLLPIKKNMALAKETTLDIQKKTL